MARTDVATTANRIRRRLGSTHRYEDLVLTAAINASDTVINLDSLPPGLEVGMVLCCDFELMRVRSINRTTGAVTVVRGYMDSTAASHLVNAIVQLNGRFTLYDIFDAMHHEIDSWAPDIFRVTSELLTVATNVETVDMPDSATGMLHLIDVRQSDDHDDFVSWPRIGARIVRGDANFTESTSGLQLRFTESVRHGSVYVQWAYPFTSTLLATNADLVNDVGLDLSMLDLLELGVARRLYGDDEGARAARQAQDESRYARETPTGSTLPSLQYTQALYVRRRSEETNRLRRLYPLRMQ